MRLTPASRHMSTCRPASATSVDPTFLNGPRPPNVIVPMVSTETRKPEWPSVRYSMRTTLRPVPDRGFGLHPDVSDQGGGGRDPRRGANIRLAAFKGE